MLAGQLLKGLNALALPARITAQTASAGLLTPLSLRLQAVGSKKGVSQSLAHRACELLEA